MLPQYSIPPATTLAILCAALGNGVAGAEVDPARLPPAATRAVDFEQDIRPIFEAACYRCHGPERPKSGFRLDNQESALRGGDLQKEDIIPGDSGRSPLVHYVARVVEDLEMPPPGKGDPLTPEQVGLLRKWIDDGAKWPAGGERAGGESMVEVTPFFRYITVDGDERKFREHWWMREGWAGGIEKFSFKEPVAPDVEFSGDGRAFIDQNDYRLSLTLRKRDVGFVRGGYDTYRKYFDDSGGYYPNPPFAGPPLSLGQDLSIDVSRAWVDAGLTRPNLPRITIGYEFQEKEGDRSLLSWGAVQDPATFESKAIAPSLKAIEDQTHIFKLDVDYTLAGWLLEDIFRAELYDVRTSRGYPDPFGPDVVTRNDESYRHFQAANAFRVERQFQDWLLGSAGYLFTHLDADGGFRQSVSSVSSGNPLDSTESTQIILDQSTHTFNANMMLGPWEGLTLSAGGQVEWLRREGTSDLFNTAFGFPTAFGSDLDKNSIQEDFGLRFTAIPFTVLYADLRFGQEWIDQYESSGVGDGIDDAQDFLRDTDARRDLQQYRGGFTVSPWTPVSLDASYQHRRQRNEYDHLVDLEQTQAQPPLFPLPGDGYPAHILEHRILSDEVEARLTWRIVSWLKATLKYQWLDGEYRTTTEAAPPTAPLFYPGGTLVSGRQEADIYSIALVLTPWRRLYLSPSFSYADSEVRSAVDAPGVVAPYEGDVYSLLLSGNYLLSRKVELNATYSWSRADYTQDNFAGLPVGMEYTRHAVFGGLTHHLYKHMKISYQYGFFRYDEPSSGGYDDYTAHAVLCSVNIALP